MSASSKKKFRKELNAAEITQKQQNEQKEAAKLRRITTIFVVVLAVIVLSAVVILSIRGYQRSGVKERSTIALEIGNRELNTAELSYFYCDGINKYYSDMKQTYGNNTIYSVKMMTGLDLTLPLDQQIMNQETKETWADYFLDSAIQKAHTIYTLYDDAVRSGYKATEHDQLLIDTQMESLPIIAGYNGFRNENSYLKGMYGNGANIKSYEEYVRACILADSYSGDHYSNLNYTAEQLREAEKGKENEYNSYSYAAYYISNSKFLTDGTTDKDGNVTYSDIQQNAAQSQAEATAKQLTHGITSVTALNKAIAALPANKNEKDPAAISFTDHLYSQLNKVYADWVADSSRKAGDMAYLANTYEAQDEDGNKETKTLGYYVVFFESSNDNNIALANVRHILSKFEGGTKDEKGNLVFSDAEKEAAKKKAQEILDSWKAGEATQESFAALATEKSDDPGSKESGGLYEDIYPGEMLPAFNDWCFKQKHSSGDTDIVETELGYHIMYYVGSSDTTYRDMLISNAMKDTAMQEWHKGLFDASTITEKDMSRMPTDLPILR